jgi:hypothetical protein
MVTRTKHPADAINDIRVTTAIRFDVCLFLGTGVFARASAPTLEAAKAEATRLLAMHPGTSRRPLIYGVTADGRSGLVTNWNA